MYHSTNPFPFMDFISQDQKTNFFEGTVANYSKGSLSFDDDF